MNISAHRIKKIPFMGMVFICSYAFLSLYWLKSYGYYFWGTDELEVFSDFAMASGVRENIESIFLPHNRHLAPVFKGFLFIQYSLFGVSPAPYHAVSIALHCISALLLYKLLYVTNRDASSSSFCAVLFATNSAYYTVVAWVFLQQMVLTLIFLELSFLSVKRSSTSLYAFILPGLYCLFASLCLSYGAAFWLFTAIYYLSTRVHEEASSDIHPRKEIMRLLPLIISAALTLVAYVFFVDNQPWELFANNLPGPMLVIKGTLVIFGDTILETLGFYKLLLAAAGLADIAIDSLMNALVPAIYFVSIFSITAFLLLSFKAEIKLRIAAMTGMALAITSMAITTAMTLPSWNFDLYRVTNIVRYKYFPFFFIILSLAPLLSVTNKRAKKALFFVMPFWLVLHFHTFSEVTEINKPRALGINNVLSMIQRSVNFPIVTDKKGRKYISTVEVTSSREINELRFFEGQNIAYSKILALFKNPDELLVKDVDGSIIFLRNFVNLSPSNFVFGGNVLRKHERYGLSFMPETNTKISLKIDNPPLQSNYRYLYLWMKTGAKGKGDLLISTENSKHPVRKFEIQGGPFYEKYLLPLDKGKEISMVLPPGKYHISEARIYY